MFPTANHFINIHTHSKPLSKNTWVLRNAYHFLDDAAVKKLNYSVSVGLHPWHVRVNYQQQLYNVKKICNLKNVLAIGEIGLDRVVNTDVNLQKQAFEAQLKFATRLNKPVIIHAVRTYPDLIPYIKKYRIPFLLHQYNGSLQQTAQFLKYPHVYFSFGKDLIEQREKVIAPFQEIPVNKIFLETDVSKYRISEVYQKAAQFKETTINDLKQLIYNNFTEVFK